MKIKYQIFFSENFPFFVVKFSIYLNRRIFIMEKSILLGNITLTIVPKGKVSYLSETSDTLSYFVLYLLQILILLPVDVSITVE